MREYRRRVVDGVRHRRDTLIRSSGGRPKPQKEADIGDLWAEQDRIRLRENIEAARQKAAKKARRAAGSVNVSITIPRPHLPSMARVRASMKARKRVWLGGGVAVIVLALFAASFSLYGEAGPVDGTGDTGQGVPKTGVQGVKQEAPTFATLLPKGKTTASVGGWARVSPEGSAPVYAYIDYIGEVQLNVSQQQLPESFRQDTKGAVQQLAEQFGAPTTLNGVEDSTVYIGKDESGPQSVIMVKDDLLILIKSSSTVSNQQWTDYLNSLQHN